MGVSVIIMIKEHIVSLFHVFYKYISSCIFNSPEPTIVLARRQSLNTVHMYLYPFFLHKFMFNFQDIDVSLQKEPIYITLSVFMPKFSQSHEC